MKAPEDRCFFYNLISLFEVPRFRKKFPGSLQGKKLITMKTHTSMSHIVNNKNYAKYSDIQKLLKKNDKVL